MTKFNLTNIFKNIPKWLKALILISLFSAIGFLITYYTQNYIIFGILFGFSFIYSIEKWFFYPTRKYKVIGQIYRLFLNLTILFMFGLLIWSGFYLFSHQYFFNAIVDSLVFVTEFVFFIWMWRVISRNSWRRPSMKLTTISLIILFVILAFAGVVPFSDYKDNAINGIADYFEKLHNSDVSENNLNPTTTQFSPTTSIPTLIKTQELKDPTWAQLVSFLQQDDTDQQPYIYPIFVCADFASMLQDHAHKAGWRCAIVHLDMTGYTDPYHFGIASNAGHDCNAFQTTDKGLVYIDITGVPLGTPSPSRCVKTVDMTIGQEYIPVSLFPEIGWLNVWDDMGTVTGIDIEW